MIRSDTLKVFNRMIRDRDRIDRMYIDTIKKFDCDICNRDRVSEIRSNN